MKTVFITGASTGIGHECAKVFMENGWNVVATMRKPQNASDDLKRENVLIIEMDVTDNDSIRKAINEAVCKFGQIDVLINNAGYYSIGVVEAIPEEEIRRQIETNLLGLIYTTKAILPYMRKKEVALSLICHLLPAELLFHFRVSTMLRNGVLKDFHSHCSMKLKSWELMWF